MSNTIDLHSKQDQNSSISKNSSTEITVAEIQNLIISLPDRPKGMLAKDLAVVYNTEPRYLNRAVERNPDRFPADFMFQATDEETKILVCQFGTTIQSTVKSNPYLFTREGANMLSAVLHSKIAVERSVQIMRAFSQMEQAKGEPAPDHLPPIQDSKYFISFHNPSVVMSIKKKDCSDNFQRFIDFGAGVMFPVQKDNSIQMSDHQYNKVMDIIGMELKSMMSYGFSNGVFGQKELRIDDAGTLPIFDKFSQLESTQKMLQIELSAATSQIEEMKALRIAEEAIRTKAHINNKKTASAMGKAGALAKKNKKLQQENALLKKQLAEQSIFQAVDAKNKF